jgi:tetratricopeptide (TPR) repeat protein
MNPHYQRGILLLSQSRYDLAEGEFRQALSNEPTDGLSHAYLGLSLSWQGRNEEALRESEEAIRFEPRESFCYYVRGHVLLALDRYREAEASVRQAIELSPFDAENHSLMAAIEVGRRRWPQALEAANKGLEIDPDNVMCLNLRSMALVNLGRREEASQTLGSTLAENPEDATTHANQGWALLHQGDHKKALEHFREALRLQPNMEWARVGILESLKSGYFIYRIMLRFFLWMGRKTEAAQWVVILGMVFGRQLLGELAKNYPALEPFINPLIGLIFGFVLLTWVSGPVFNFLLMFSKFGRLALTGEEKIEATTIGVCFSLAVGFFIANIFINHDITFVPMTILGLGLIPLTLFFKQQSVSGRWVMGLALLVLLGLAMPILLYAILGPKADWIDLDKALKWFTMFIYGTCFSSWIPALLGLRNIRR